MGKGNLCANCHNSRYKATDLVKPVEANKVAGHWGAHHGPEADMLLGTNAYEYPGKKILQLGPLDTHQEQLH
jgi:hypothetical protein